jgi:hypothetical protein
VAAGLLVAYAVGGTLSRFLFEVPARSPAGYLMAAAGMLVVAFFAAAIPARRAVGIPLASTLRAD